MLLKVMQSISVLDYTNALCCDSLQLNELKKIVFKNTSNSYFIFADIHNVTFNMADAGCIDDEGSVNTGQKATLEEQIQKQRSS
jgi:hypothetical protein